MNTWTTNCPKVKQKLFIFQFGEVSITRIIQAKTGWSSITDDRQFLQWMAKTELEDVMLPDSCCASPCGHPMARSVHPVQICTHPADSFSSAFLWMMWSSWPVTGPTPSPCKLSGQKATPTDLVLKMLGPHLSNISHLQSWSFENSCSWWLNGKESIYQCRGHRFDPWSEKIPHALEQLSPWATTVEPVL